MVQYTEGSGTDTVDTNTFTLKGDGWLIGPYAVFKSDYLPLTVEGRLLFGSTKNEITTGNDRPYGGTFDTDRRLTMIRIKGDEMSLTKSISYSPYVDLGHITEDLDAFEVSGSPINGQTVKTRRYAAGVDFDIPLGEKTVFAPGLSVALSDKNAGAETRGKINLGLAHNNGDRDLYLRGHYDGIGDSGYESYGFSVGVDFTF